MNRIRGFSLVEIVTVLAVIGIGIGLFYSVFFLNWSLFEKQLTLVDLGQEADRIMEMISFDARVANQINVSPDKRTATFIFRDINGNIVNIITYTLILPDQIQRGNQILSENIDFADSSFEEVGNSLVVELLLEDDVFGQSVNLPVKTQVFSRRTVL